MARPPIASILSLRERALVVLAFALLNTAVYLLSNAHPLHAPIALPRNALDQALGWHAWTIWPYWLLIALAPAMALCLRDRWIMATTLRAYALALGINLAIWLSCPTTIARPMSSDTLDPFTAGAWHLLYAIDAPNNCFPSGHVTIPVTIAAGLCAQHQAARYWLWPLLALLLPSVVTTGQHTSWDVLGGLATAAIGLLVFGRDLVTDPPLLWQE